MALRRIIIAALALAAPLSLAAATFYMGSEFAVRKGETAPGNAYILAQNVTIAGAVERDVLALGNIVFISDSVGEDALIVGNNVSVVSSVGGDLRVLSATSLISGTVDGDIAMLSANGRTLPGTHVAGDIIAGGGKIVIEGEVKGKVTVSAKTVHVNADIAGSLNITADEIVIGDEALIGGDFSYKSMRQADISPLATVLGEVYYNEMVIQKSDGNFFSFLWSSWFLVRFIILFVSALILYAVLGKSLVRLSVLARKEKWRNIASGLLFVVAAIVASVLLVFTVIGLPLSAATIALSVLFGIVAAALSPIVVGSYIQVLSGGGEDVTWKTVLLGSAVFVVVGSLPLVGLVFKTVFYLLSLGTIARVLFAKMQLIRE